MMKVMTWLWGHAKDLPLAHFRQGLPMLVLHDLPRPRSLAHSLVSDGFGGLVKVCVAGKHTKSNRFAKLFWGVYDLY